MSAREQDDLSALEYVLGLTDAETRSSLDKRFNEEAEFAAEVFYWQKALSLSDMTTPDVTPPSACWQRIARDLNLNPDLSRPESRRQPGFWLGWGLAAAMAGVLIFTTVIQPDSPDTLQPVAVLRGVQPDAQFVVSLNKSASRIEVSALNIPLPQNKNFQLWLIRGGAAPQSLGLIQQRDRNSFRLPSGALDNQTMLAVSLEPVGGSKQSGPSGPVIFQGKVTLL